MIPDVVVVTNSPGEVAGWVKPTVARLVERAVCRNIHVVLTPCYFSSGREAEVISSMPGVTSVMRPRQYLEFVLTGRRPSWFDPGPGGIVVHLGGDHMHSAILARKLGYPAVAYTDRTLTCRGSFDSVMAESERVIHKLIRKGVPRDRLVVTGSLTVDAVRPTMDRDRAREFFGVPKDKYLVGLFPGSKKVQLDCVLPFMLKVAEMIASVEKRCVFVICLSPFATAEQLKQAVLTGPARRGLEGVKGSVTADGSVALASGLTIPVVAGRNYDVMVASDLALVTPGTITAELAVMGVPMVVAGPLNLPGAVPLPGTIGLLGSVPVVGPLLRRWLVPKVIGRIEFLAIPNKRARRQVVPEVRGIIRAEDVVIPAAALVSDEKSRSRISRELSSVMGERGAADRVVDVILESYARRYGQEATGAACGRGAGRTQ